MVSAKHQAPLDLIRNRTDFAVELLVNLAGVDVPAHHHVSVDDTDLSDTVPTQLFADTTLVLHDPDDQPIAGIIVENQLAKDPRKRFTWPHYVIALRSKIECPVYLLVLCPSDDIARWAATPIDLVSGVFTPIVLGPAMIPVVTDPDTARADPELAVLSAITHPHNRSVLNVLPAVLDPDIPAHRLYAAIICTVLAGYDLKQLEAIVKTQAHAWVIDTEWGRELIEKLTAEAVAAAVAEAVAEAAATAAAEHEVGARADALLAVLHARSINVDATVRERITSCADAGQLSAWIVRAATATTLTDVFD